MTTETDALSTTYSKQLKEDAMRKKLVNIHTFSEIERTGLHYQIRERRILLHTTARGERVYIQYPGKESAREGDKMRPWDFKPKIMLPDGSMMSDISFKDVWNDLATISESHDSTLPILATVLFRMAYMVDHQDSEDEYECGEINFETGKISLCKPVHLKYERYSPNKDVLSYLQKEIGDLRGISVEAYLLVNDYLAQNEDCKYYYRDSRSGAKGWKGDIGRRNNLLTHIAIIGFLEKKIRFTEITDQFQRMRGVAPIPDKCLSDVTDHLVMSEHDRQVRTARLD